MKISKYQHTLFDYIDSVDYDDYHSAVEDEISLYKYENRLYLVITITSLKEDGGYPKVVFKYNLQNFNLALEHNEEIILNVLNQYENDNQ